jgi:signal transduction histidine kinase/putative methionine-R-sulfoxide reductase with GAF domain
VTEGRERRGRLFWKYTVVLVALVSLALLASGGIELYFSYRENTEALGQIQREKALGAASRIEQFVREIERQMGWTTQPLLATGAAAVEQRRLDYFRLLRQVPAVTEVSQIDSSGREQLRVSRLAMDVVGSGTDLSRDPRFVEATAGRTYFSQVYFRKESEPYMTVSMAGSGGSQGTQQQPGATRQPVTAAEVNLKFIWDVVSQIKIGRAGRAYVVDAQGHLIAHPDISLVLKKTDLSGLPQVQAALRRPGATDVAGLATVARDLQGRSVLTAHAEIAPLGWVVFVDQPLEEAFATLSASITRTLVLLATGVALSVLASLLLARKMVTPIRALQAGAARLEAGALDQRIAVRTGDELEGLAEQFNRMAATLQESYAGLERKVDERTSELREALEQQTATADILRVISQSPTNVQPVLDAIAENAVHLCEALAATILLREGDAVVPHAHFGPLGAPVGERQPIDRGWVTGRAVIESRTVHVPDLTQAPEDDYPKGKAMALRYGHRATLATPLLREGQAIGALLVRRQEPRPFSEKQIAILETFARQAVIAIENVRLFQELQARNRELTDALEQQTATGEILRVISSSPTDLQPVMTAIVENAARLVDAQHAYISRAEGNVLRWLAFYGTTPISTTGVPITRNLPSGRAILDGQTTQVDDVSTLADEFDETVGRANREQGVRTVLATPLLREGTAIGVLVVRRTEVRRFTDKQIALLKTFADQAVIAIENVRLFQELQARTRDLGQSLEEVQTLSEVGQALSSSLDMQRVLETVAAQAVKLSGCDACGIFEFDSARGAFEVVASHNLRAEFLAEVRTAAYDPRRSAIRRATASGQPVQVPDILATDDVHAPELARREGFRAIIAVPMGGGDVTRGLVLFRRAPGTFDDRVVALLSALASQSQVAIENARLFTEIEDKSRQLTVANQHKSEFLANMSHELRTPLNAVIGFSEVLLERMFGDVNQKQEEYLQDIVSSGRHLLSLINDILDLSKIEAGRMELELGSFDLQIALENALTLVRERAVRRGIRLELKTDSRLGTFVGDERKFKQILLNLLSNAVKFTPEGGRVTLTGVLANGSVEVAVIDTGIGIAPEDQEAIFEEFRQVGRDYASKREGTGLGLTLAKKFVELHGGKIWVKSEVGRGSTFTISLPLRNATHREGGADA